MKQALQQHKTVLFGLLLILLGLAVGLATPVQQLHWQPRITSSGDYGLHDLWQIAGRNLLIGLQLLIGVVSLGLFGVMQFFSIGFSVGMTFKAGLGAGISFGKISLLLMPHTFLEFAGFLLLGALEFEAARLAYYKLRYDQLPLDQPRLVGLLKQALFGIILIVIAALVEVYITFTLARRWL
ncbi:MAG: stage II sporulation protein M [Acidobacteria bacterium]|nr:stage II sporulation protein M [Acidobacteriota bacterium]